MKFFIYLNISIILTISTFSYATVKDSSHKKIIHQIEKKIRAKNLKKSSLGLVISKINSNNTSQSLYELNSEKLFIPASLAKIASLSALYHYYPPSYTFKTSFLSSASIKNDILEGDLVLKGGGDSSFTSESLWNLVNILIRSGIKEIKGDLLVDDKLYTKEPQLPYSERSYLAPASASSFNWNSVTFRIRPNKKLNKPAQIFIDPKNSYIKIINKVKTGKRNKITIKRLGSSTINEVFKIEGIINITKNELVKYRNIQNPALWMGYNAISFLNERGIKILGKVKKGTCFSSCKKLAEWESKPFPFLTYNLMKYSNNFVARMLVMHLPLLKGDKKGDLKRGMKFVENYLKQHEKIKNFRLLEPSGLSRKNQLTPKDLQKMLINSRNNFYNSEMLFSYPLIRGKGTLQNRFKKFPASFHVRAKTGSLYKVSGLAGLANSYKQDYVFVFIFNGNNSKKRQAQDLFEEIIFSVLK